MIRKMKDQDFGSPVPDIVSTMIRILRLSYSEYDIMELLTEKKIRRIIRVVDNETD